MTDRATDPMTDKSADRCQTWGYYTGRRCELLQGHTGGHRLEVVVEPLTHRPFAVSDGALTPTDDGGAA